MHYENLYKEKNMKRTKIYFRNLKNFEERIEGPIKENEAQIFIKNYEKCPDADGCNIYCRVLKILLDSFKILHNKNNHQSF